MPKLNPCECGGSPFLYENGRYCIVYCRTCEDATPTGDKAEVIDLWNGTDDTPPVRGTVPMKVVRAHQKADHRKSMPRQGDVRHPCLRNDHKTR